MPAIEGAVDMADTKARALEIKATGAAHAVNVQAVGSLSEAERDHFLQLMQMTIQALSR